MKALVYNGPGKRSWEEKPKPEIQAPTASMGIDWSRCSRRRFASASVSLAVELGVKDTSVQRNKGASPSEAEMEKRFAQMDAAKVTMQILSICPQGPHFDKKANSVAAARAANDDGRADVLWVPGANRSEGR